MQQTAFGTRLTVFSNEIWLLDAGILDAGYLIEWLMHECILLA
jgi:hypothetical protein